MRIHFMQKEVVVVEPQITLDFSIIKYIRLFPSKAIYSYFFINFDRILPLFTLMCHAAKASYIEK